MTVRTNPEEYFSGGDRKKESTEGQPQVNEYHNYYYQREEESNPQMPEKFVYLGIFIAGLFVGYLMAKGG